jgi:hypothetical protein
MKVKINFPKSGMGIEEGTVLRWLRVVGDVVMRGRGFSRLRLRRHCRRWSLLSPACSSRFSPPDGNAIAVNSLLGVIETNE